MTFDEWIKQYQTKKIYLFKLNVARKVGGEIETKDIYLATEPYFDGANFYEPLVCGMPYFSRSIQEVIFGISQVSFGSLCLITAENKLDNILANYNFNGRDIEVKLGGEEIPYSEFKVILAGKMGAIRYDDQKLTMPIEDKQVVFLRKMTPAGVYNDYVADVVHTVLNNIGIDDTQIDLDALNQFDADCPYVVYISTDGNENVRKFFDRLLTPMLVWYGFNREGLFQIGIFKEPDQTAVMEFKDDIEILSFSAAVFKKHYWKIKLSYITDTTTDPPTRDTISHEDNTIKDVYPLAMESGVKESYLTALADAQETLDRWWDMLSVQRQIIKAKFKVQPLRLNLNDTVYLSRPRFNIDDYYRIISLRENYDRNEVEVELFK